MLKKHASTADGAPKALGPYSQSLSAANLVFVSGQIGIDPETGEITGDSAATQTEQALKNIEAILGSLWLSMDYIVKTTIYLTNIDDYPAVNEVYSKFFREPYPARACVEVSKLPENAMIEIEAIAIKQK